MRAQMLDRRTKTAAHDQKKITFVSIFAVLLPEFVSRLAFLSVNGDYPGEKTKEATRRGRN